MKNTFSSESNNPRIRRAYAHATRDAALRTGDPNDKIKALNAATKAMLTKRGEELGAQALSAFRKASSVELADSPLVFPRTHKHGEFTVDSIAGVMQKVSDIDGERLGVSVTTSKPKNPAEYEDAFRDMDEMKVVTMQGYLEADGTPADKPRTEEEIQSGARYNHGAGTHYVTVEASQDTADFYSTVRSVTHPHTL